jgi:hypothetical protein
MKSNSSSQAVSDFVPHEDNQYRWKHVVEWILKKYHTSKTVSMASEMVKYSFT